MKKITMIILLILTTVSLTACNNNDKNNSNYKELNAISNQSNEYNKLVVNSISNTSRQENVLTDPTTSSLYQIPGNGIIEQSSTKKYDILNNNEEIYNFDSLSENGLYHLEGVNTSVQLFKHRGADNQVASYLEDDTAVIKSFTLRNSIYPVTESEIVQTPVNITGLYAPAGELVKIEISEELAKTNPKIYIGSTSMYGQTHDIPSSDSYSRMPNRVKVLTLSDTINYVGSPLGGQIYIQSELDEYNVTISGAVEYLHYIHNTTTKDELIRLYDSTAPMIDIEIPDFIRINMPKDEINKRELEIYNELTEDLENFNEKQYKEQAKLKVVDEIIEVANYWKLVSEISTYICPEYVYRTNDVSIFFDSYVVTSYSEVGKNYTTFAIAEGRNLLNAKEDKMTELTAYNKHFWNNDLFIEKGSSEITSNVLTILSYMLYDTYGANRTYNNNEHTYSDAANTLRLINTQTSGTTYETAKYATLIHSFGVHTFIKAITTEVEAQTIYDRLYLQFSYITNTDMLYYFEEVLGYTISADCISEISSKNYNMYIPAASSLQIGQVINGQNIYLSQAYEMYSFEEINIADSIVVPKDMEVEILSIGKTKGNLEEENGVFLYSATANELDEFNVKIKVFNHEYSYETTFIFGVCTQYSNTVYSSSTTTLYNNVDNVSLDEINYSDLTINKSFNLSSSSLQYSVDTGYNGVFVTYAEIVFPSTQDYTIVARGLGDIKISIGDSYNNLEEVIRFKREGTTSSFDKENTDTTHTLTAYAYQRVCIKIEISTVVFNTYERAEFYLGYVNGNSVTEISADWWYGQYSAAPLVNAPTTSVYSTPVTNLDEVSDDLTFVKTFAFNSPTFGNGQTNGYYVTHAYIVLPETKEYTLIVAGRGDIRISIGESHDNLQEVLRYSSIGTVSNYDISDNTSKFTINAVAGEKILVKVELFDPVRGEFNLGYVDGTDVVDLTEKNWYGSFHVNKDRIDYSCTAYNNESFYSPTNKISSYSRIDEDVNIIYQTGKLDDKFLTTPNSDAQSMDPGSIIIYKYSQQVSANYFALKSASETDGVVSFFEIHVSNNGVNWEAAFTGINDYAGETSAQLLSTFTFQYVKLVFIETYSGNYIDICNFELQYRCINATVLDVPSEGFLYTGNANVVENNYNLNKNVLEFDNKLKFTFTGNNLLLLCNTDKQYGLIEVKVNGVVYTFDLNSESYSQELFVIAGLKHGTYEVEITVLSKLGNIDFIAVE